MKKRLIALICIATLLIVSFGALATPVAAASIRTSTYTHRIPGNFGTTTITYTFQTYVDWTYQNYDKLSVRIQVWAGLTSQRAEATAKVDRIYYTKFLWWYIKHSTNVFSQYLVANPITQSYADYTWPVTINPYGVEYTLTSYLKCWDLNLLNGGPDEEYSVPQIVTPARDPIMY